MYILIMYNFNQLFILTQNKKIALNISINYYYTISNFYIKMIFVLMKITFFFYIYTLLPCIITHMYESHFLVYIIFVYII